MRNKKRNAGGFLVEKVDTVTSVCQAKTSDATRRYVIAAWLISSVNLFRCYSGSRKIAGLTMVDLGIMLGLIKFGTAKASGMSDAGIESKMTS
jgi:hypothetical protein